MESRIGVLLSHVSRGIALRRTDSEEREVEEVEDSKIEESGLHASRDSTSPAALILHSGCPPRYVKSHEAVVSKVREEVLREILMWSGMLTRRASCSGSGNQ